MVDFGKGPTLKEASPWLRDDAKRHALILEVAERNSVIEGLPPFQDETREQLREVLKSLCASAPRSAPPE